ncbi:MAG TPA: hypothetical protein VFN57_14400 [Thermomicrobiaceae bacterium]|nr:hypothetical protein [Thermomicrobiaceae bacterium]
MSRWVHALRGRRLVVAAAIAVLVLAGVGLTAYATGNTAFYGCYDPYVRVISDVGLGSANPCPAWETPVSWAQTGPPGPQGPPGTPGPQGPAGTGNAVNVYSDGSTTLPLIYNGWVQVAAVSLEIPGSTNHQVLVTGHVNMLIPSDAGGNITLRVLLDDSQIDVTSTFVPGGQVNVTETLPFSRVLSVGSGLHSLTVELFDQAPGEPAATAYSLSAIDLGAVPPAP